MLKKTSLSIPFSRLVIYLMVLGLLPLVFVGYHFFSQKQQWNLVNQQIFSVREIAEGKIRKQHLNTLVREKFSDFDQFYLNHHLETLSFLRHEKESLEKVIQNPAFTGNEAIEKRHLFLTGPANRIQFTEGASQNGEGFVETIEIMSHPVEIDDQDLKEILNRIEGIRPGKPQLIISDFKLVRKALSGGNEVFETHLKLLKREYPK